MKKKLTPKATAQLENLRALIDKIDRQIVKLLNMRAQTALKLGRLKKQLNCPIRAKQREQEVTALVLKHNRGHFSKKRLIVIYRMIIAGCREVQKKK